MITCMTHAWIAYTRSVGAGAYMPARHHTRRLASGLNAQAAAPSLLLQAGAWHAVRHACESQCDTANVLPGLASALAPRQRGRRAVIQKAPMDLVAAGGAAGPAGAAACRESPKRGSLALREAPDDWQLHLLVQLRCMSCVSTCRATGANSEVRTRTKR
jgi:hypothetical protein